MPLRTDMFKWYDLYMAIYINNGPAICIFDTFLGCYLMVVSKALIIVLVVHI